MSADIGQLYFTKDELIAIWFAAHPDRKTTTPLCAIEQEALAGYVSTARGYIWYSDWKAVRAAKGEGL